MLKHNFSQEGEVAREIEILIMRIFGLLTFMETISKQLKVTELDSSDASWLGEITENMKYNSASLGAKLWDLVCKWNQDILTVEFWLRTYVKENETRSKYFVEPLKEWEKKLLRLDDVKKIFENSGAVNSDHIKLQNDKKEIETENKLNVNVISKGRILYQQLETKFEKKKVLCTKYKGIIQIKENEIVCATTRQKELEQTNKDLTDSSKLLENQCNNYMNEVLTIPNLKAIVASGKVEYDFLKKKSTDEIESLTKENHTSQIDIMQKDKQIHDLKIVEKNLSAQTVKFDNLQKEMTAMKVECGQCEEANIVSEALIHKQTHDLKIIENNLSAQTVKFNNLQTEMTAMKVECDQCKEQNIVSEALIHKQMEQLKAMPLDNSSTDSDESKKRKSMKELEGEIIASEKQIEITNERLKISEKRNYDQQKIIDDQRKKALDSASDTNYTRLQEEKKRLEVDKEEQEIKVRRMGAELKILWGEVTSASGKGYDITSPERLKSIIKSQEQEGKSKESKQPASAKSSYFWTKTGPRPYII